MHTEIGVYPAEGSWFELRYTQFQEMHWHVQEHYPELILPWLPRQRWLGSKHPAYLAELCGALQKYLRLLLSQWQQAHTQVDEFIMLLHALHSDSELPLPLPESAREEEDEGAPGGGGSAPSARRLASADSAKSNSSMGSVGGRVGAAQFGWQQYRQHIEERLHVGQDANPFESDEEALTAGLHAWSVERFTVRKLESPENMALHSRDAYIVLAGEPGAWDLHYWCGTECPSDKRGAAAVLVVLLCEYIADDGGCPHRRETPREESERFLSHFSAVRHEAGGTPSGWRRRLSDQQSPRLLRVTAGPGCLGTVAHVPPSVAYLDAAAAYVLDLPGTTSFDVEEASRLAGQSALAAPPTHLGYPLGNRGALDPSDGDAPAPPQRVAAGVVAAPPFSPPHGTQTCVTPGRNAARALVGDASPRFLRESAARVAEVYQWHGHDASLRAKANAMLVAQGVRAIDRGGACRAHIMPADVCESKLLALESDADGVAATRREALPPPPPAAPRRLFRFEMLPPLEGAAADAQRALERKADGSPPRPMMPRLRASDCEVGAGSLCSSALESYAAFVLDCGSELYVWSGRAASGYVRWVARTYAQQLAASRPGAAPTIARETEGCEGILFRSKFGRWHWQREANPAAPGRASRKGGALSADSEEDLAGMRRQCELLRSHWRGRGQGEVARAAAALPDGVEGSPLRASGLLGEEALAGGADADDESEMLSVWLVSASNKYLLPEAERGVFWSGNCYMVLYSWEQDTKEKCQLFFWKGQDISQINFLTWRFHLSQLLKDMPGAPAPLTIAQGQEPARFVSLMEGMIVLTGRHPLTRASGRRSLRSPSLAARADAARWAGDEGNGAVESPPNLRQSPVRELQGGEGEGEEEVDGVCAESLPALGGVVLLQVKRYCSGPLGVCARQLPAQPYYLDSHDVCILFHASASTLYTWDGELAPPSLQAAGRALAERLRAAQPSLRLRHAAELHEPPTFWDAMTHPAQDAAFQAASQYGHAFDGRSGSQLTAAVEHSVEWRKAQGPRRSLLWRVRALGRAAARVELLSGREERYTGCPSQHRLAADAVTILDAAVCVFVWVGPSASEEDETLGMELAQRYSQRDGHPPTQVSHVLAGNEPDEFRRLFHGWYPWVAESLLDPHQRRRERFCRQNGLAGRVMRGMAWPTAPDMAEAGLHAEAQEEVLSSGVVLFSTSCGIVRDTVARCGRPRAAPSEPTGTPGSVGGASALLAQRGVRFLEVDLATQPAELQTLRLLQAANKLRDPDLCRRLPVAFINGVLVEATPPPPGEPPRTKVLSTVPADLQELEDEGTLAAALKSLSSATPVVAREQLPRLDALDPARTLHEGWLLKEGGIGPFQSWKRRWCVLQPDGVYYFRARQPDEAVAGLILVRDATCEVLSSDYHFRIVTARRTFLLRIDRPAHAAASVDAHASGKELAAWMAALQRAHCILPGDESARMIRRVHHLRPEIGSTLLTQVSQKRAQYGEKKTPERRKLPDGGGATARQLLPPELGSGWLWKFEEAAGSWRQLWSVLQGQALLCYEELFSADEAPPPAQSGAAATDSEGGETGGAIAPHGVNLERPCHVLWLSGSQLLPSSDSADAPSEFTFTLHVPSARQCHRLCTNTEEQKVAWVSLLEAIGLTSASRAPSLAPSLSASPRASLTSSPHSTSPQPMSPLGGRRESGFGGASMRDESDNVSNW